MLDHLGAQVGQGSLGRSGGASENVFKSGEMLSIWDHFGAQGGQWGLGVGPNYLGVAPISPAHPVYSIQYMIYYIVFV